MKMSEVRGKLIGAEQDREGEWTILRVECAESIEGREIGEQVIIHPAAEREPQVDAEVIEQARKALAHLSSRESPPFWSCRHAFARKALRDLLAAVEAPGELLTREECWEELREAFDAACDAYDLNRTQVSVKPWGSVCFVAEANGIEEVAADPIAALEALTEAAKPSRPDPDEMSVEELEAELDAAEGVEWVPFTDSPNANRYGVVVTLNGSLLRIISARKSEEDALRRAVRDLREHLDEEAA